MNNGLKFALPAIKMWCEAMIGKADFYQTVDSSDPENPKISVSIEGLAKFIQCGYINNCEIKEVEPLFKYENFFNWVEKSINDEAVTAQILEVMKCYQESIYFAELNKPNGAAKSEDEKKKLVGMT
jgi:hypothetical protein